MSKSDRETQRVPLPARSPAGTVETMALLRDAVASLPKAIKEALDYKGGRVEVTTLERSDWGDAWELGPLSRRGGPAMRLDITREVRSRKADRVAVIADIGEGWRVRLDLVPTEDDELKVTDIHMRPTSQDGAEVGARLLRRMGFGEVLNEAARWLQHEGVLSYIGGGWAKPIARPGRRGREDELYAKWAERYVDALEQAHGRPVAWLVEEAAKRGEHLTDTQVRWYLTEARRRGLLTAAPKGKSGGELTDKARALLAVEG